MYFPDFLIFFLLLNSSILVSFSSISTDVAFNVFFYFSPHINCLHSDFPSFVSALIDLEFLYLNKIMLQKAISEGKDRVLLCFSRWLCWSAWEVQVIGDNYLFCDGFIWKSLKMSETHKKTLYLLTPIAWQWNPVIYGLY